MKNFSEILKETHNRIYNNPVVKQFKPILQEIDPRDGIIAKQAKEIKELEEDILEITGGKGVFNYAVHNSNSSR